MIRLARACGAILLLGGAACVQTFDTTTLGIPVSMGQVEGDTTGAVPFRTSAHSTYAFLGLVTISRASLQKALAHQLVGGKRVSQVRITTRSRFFDVLVTGLTLGLIVPRTVVFEGVVTGAPPPAAP